MEVTTQNTIPKIAIIGMDCLVAGCQNLEEFERSIYEGNQHFIPLPQGRYQQTKIEKESELKDDTKSLGGYIQEFAIDIAKFPISSAEIDNCHPEELLMLKVAYNAIRDAGIQPQTKMAVVIVAPNEGENSVPESSRYHANKSVPYVACLENITNAIFSIVTAEKSVFPALELAQKLLTNREVDAVLVGAVDLSGVENSRKFANSGLSTLSYDENAHGTIVGEGAAAIVFKRDDTARAANNRIYAVIDALALLENFPLEPETISQVCRLAFNIADIESRDIGYLEVCASGIEPQDLAEIQGLLPAYRTFESSLHCAIGSVKANVGHTFVTSGIVSLVKTALCLYYHYLPAVPQWSSPKMSQEWESGPFYVMSQSKPWFLEPGATKRIAAINNIEPDGSYAHLILSEEPSHKLHSNRYLEQMPFYLLAISGDDESSLLAQLENCVEDIKNNSDLGAIAKRNFLTWQKRQKSSYTLGILGHNQDELIREIQRASEGIPTAFRTGENWQTPIGSYFTPKPLAEKGRVAFVYPGSFTSYIGLSQHLFRLFPQLYDDPLINTVYTRVANIEKLLYPRSWKKFSKRQLAELEKNLIADPVTMLESEVGFAGLMTAILKNYFQIKSECAFGYSLGETSTMLAQGVWTSFKETSDYLNSSSLFKTQLSEPKNAVRNYWGLPLLEDGSDQEFWSNYILICPVNRVREALKQENRVYLSLINTPEEVVIAGETQACKRVIKILNCEGFPTSINHVIHCEPMRSEYDNLAKINTLPIEDVSDTIFYSAAEYKPITLDSYSIGQNIAKSLCYELDFPRLINRVYEDGFNIFIEVGVGSNCSRWIGEILKHKEHVTTFVNRRGVDDHSSIVKALAKLISHRVNLDLSPLYSASDANNIPNQSVTKIINLNCGMNNQHKSLYSLVNGHKQQYKTIQPPNYLVNKNYLPNLPNLSNLQNPQYQKLSDNNTLMTQSHAILLQSRYESLQQIGAMIQQQIAIQQNLFK